MSQQTPTEAMPSRSWRTTSCDCRSSTSTLMLRLPGSRMKRAMSSRSDSAIAEAVATSRTCPLTPLPKLEASLAMRSSVNRTLFACSSTERPAGVGSTPRRERIKSAVPRSCSSWAIRLLTADGSMCSSSAARAMLRCSQTATSRRKDLRSMSRMARDDGWFCVSALEWLAFQSTTGCGSRECLKSSPFTGPDRRAPETRHAAVPPPGRDPRSRPSRRPAEHPDGAADRAQDRVDPRRATTPASARSRSALSSRRTSCRSSPTRPSWWRSRRPFPSSRSRCWCLT